MLNEMNIPLEEDGIEEEILVDEEVTITKAMWGDIGGNIENQTDLQNALDAKQDSLTEAQLNAVNSGITSEKVTTYDGYADQIARKADQSALNAESITRGEADTALGTRIDNEALARQQADNGLQSQIDAITSKSDVVDVVANYAALQAYDTSSLGNNDVIKVLDDETHEDALTYYRWSTATQTWSYIGQEAPYYSKGQMDVKLAEKQDKLTAGANIQIQNGTISATDTTYTAGTGLNLNGTEFSADTDVLATKEDLEGYYTKTEADNLLAPKLEAEVLAELPTTGEEGKLYLTPKAHTTQTATGNPITISLGEDAGQITSAQLDGDTFQQSYTGKNLFDKTNIANLYNAQSGVASNTNAKSVIVKCSPSTTYTYSNPDGASMKSDSSIGFYPSEPVAELSNTGSSLIIGTTTEQTFTTPANTEYLLFYFAWGTNGSEEAIQQAQIEEGSTATSYEPYVGGTPSPNPSYPQPIQTVTGEQTVTVVGKNLFDKDNIDTRNGYLYNTTFSYRTSNADKTFIVPCEPNTTYTISRSVITSSFRAAYIDLKPSEIPADASSETSLTCAGYIANNSGTSITITTSATAKSLLVHYGNTNTDGVTLIDQSVATIMVEKSVSATTYAPYSKRTLPLDLGSIELCKLGTYQDYIWKDEEDWKVHKATNKIILDGSNDEGWQLNTAYPTEYMCSKTNLGVTAPSGSTASVCSDFIVTSVAPASKGNYRIGGSYLPFNYDNGDGGVESFKTWLSQHNVTVYVILATPTDTVITDQTLIAQLEAIRTASLQASNTITNTATGSNLAGDMELGYYEYDPTNRYDKWLWLDINNEYEQIRS